MSTQASPRSQSMYASRDDGAAIQSSIGRRWGFRRKEKAGCPSLRLRSEAVTFLMSSKNRCCKQNSYNDKLVINLKKSQTLRAGSFALFAKGWEPDSLRNQPTQLSPGKRSAGPLRLSAPDISRAARPEIAPAGRQHGRAGRGLPSQRRSR